MDDANPYEPTTSQEQATSPLRRVSNSRGCGFGCLYAFITWIGLGILVAMLIPIVFRGPEWNHRGLGNIAGQIVFWVFAIPAGIIGFIRHRRMSAASDNTSSNQDSKNSVDLGMVAGWLVMGAIVGVIVAIVRDVDSRTSGAIVGAWTMGGGMIGLIIFVFGKLFVRRR